jgi:hypothetical protein
MIAPIDLTGRVDWAEAARGASTGLSVLVIGGLTQPLVGMLLAPLGAVWLIVVAVMAFAAAGRRIGGSSAPGYQGAAAAVLGYLFVLPLVAFVNRGLDAAQVGATLGVAVLVGGATGALSGRRRQHRSTTATRERETR